MKSSPLVVTLCLSLAGLSAGAEELPKELAFGLQAGVAMPTGDDLRITTRPGLHPSLGIHATWIIDEFHSLRPRLDLWTFGTGHQEVSVPQSQRIETTVQGTVLGVDYLRHFGYGRRFERWAAGVGLYAIRWSVKSTNQLAFSGGTTVQAAGTSSWTRPGLGLVGCCRLTPHLQVEARWISSRYGNEDLPANVGTLGLLWHF